MDKTVLQKVYSYIDEFLSLKRGDTIKNHTESIRLNEVSTIKRRGLKHIVESRLEDGYSPEKIKLMMTHAPNVVKEPEFRIPNKNKRYPGSEVSVRYFTDEKQALLVIHQGGEIKDIFNAYYRSKPGYERLLKELK